MPNEDESRERGLDGNVIPPAFPNIVQDVLDNWGKFVRSVEIANACGVTVNFFSKRDGCVIFVPDRQELGVSWSHREMRETLLPDGAEDLESQD
jgi:hypothetical protein